MDQRPSFVHPPTSRLQDWLDGLLSESASQEVEVHLAGCEAVCQLVIDGLAKNGNRGNPKQTVDYNPPEIQTAPPHDTGAEGAADKADDEDSDKFETVTPSGSQIPRTRSRPKLKRIG